MISKTSAVRTAIRQVKVTILANMKSRYRGSIAGFVWVVLNPLIIYGVQSFVFHTILKFDMPNYFIFLLSGLLPWIFISQSLDMCTTIFVNSGRLIKSFPIHPMVCLLAQIFDNFFNLILLILILIPAALCLTNFPLWKFPLLGIPLVTCLIAVVGLAWLLATIQVFFRDLKFVIGFILNLSFFLTPIFYPENFIDREYQWMLKFNLFRYIILPFRNLLEDPVPVEFWQNSAVALLLGCTLCLFAAGYWRYKRNVALFYI